nr:uncharacterized protein LOC113827698 [Penaeus vannamei]
MLMVQIILHIRLREASNVQSSTTTYAVQTSRELTISVPDSFQNPELKDCEIFRTTPFGRETKSGGRPSSLDHRARIRAPGTGTHALTPTVRSRMRHRCTASAATLRKRVILRQVKCHRRTCCSEEAERCKGALVYIGQTPSASSPQCFQRATATKDVSMSGFTLCITLLVAATLAAGDVRYPAAPSYAAPIPILKDDRTQSAHGDYSVDFEAANGIARQESGSQSYGQAAQGGWRYTSPRASR